MNPDHKKGSKHNRGGFLKDPRTMRPGEQIGGGFFVFRRGDGTGRIRPSIYPFEYPNEADAKAEAQRLAGLNPGNRFEVFKTTGYTVMQLTDETAAELAAA